MPKVTELYAFVAENGPGDEGLMALILEDKVVPLVGADMERLDSFRPIARGISQASGIPYRILHFKLEGEIPK